MINLERLAEFQNTPYELLPGMLTPIESTEVGCDYYYSDTGFVFTGSPLEGFHPVACREIISKDDRYLGLRSSYQILLYGISESLWTADNDWGECVIALANHKGNFIVTAYEFTPERAGE